MPIRFSTHNGKLSCSQKSELPSGLFLLVNVLQNVNFICINVFVAKINNKIFVNAASYRHSFTYIFILYLPEPCTRGN